MAVFSAGRVLFPRLDDKRTSKPTPLPFGYSLSGIIWLFPLSRSLINNLAVFILSTLSLSPLAT
ncbi:MAG: hypothetical protein F6K39_40540 [Okeania sp. SIO3B3]|nr:hypothetical protein [Okeania sp. SIO3B3]